MTHTIKFERDRNGNTVDLRIQKIREAAKAESWTGMAGIKQWAKETHNATLRAGKYDDWTSISFESERDLMLFTLKFGA